jgi:hypothetical protein
MPRPPHSPWLDLPNDIWEWVQIMKFLIVQLPPCANNTFKLCNSTNILCYYGLFRCFCLLINKSECVSCLFVCMFKINSLTP